MRSRRTAHSLVTGSLLSVLLTTGILFASSPALAQPLVRLSTGAARSSTAHRMSAGRARQASAGRLVWSDEFNGPSGAPPDPAKWQLQTGGNGWGNQELEYYTARSRNAALDGAGHLAITARAESYTGPDSQSRSYTSARMQTEGLFQTAYGRIEARLKLPAGRGLWPAFWALGQNHDSVGWPWCGEVDIMENLGGDPFTAYGSLHGPAPGAHDGEYGLTATVRSKSSLAAAFHVFGVTWSPGRIVFTLDGVAYATRTPASLAPGQKWVFNQPFYLLLNLAVGGQWPGRPSAATHFPATMFVDWVRVYS
jgi:beta-glucanase (GH16 family)